MNKTIILVDIFLAASQSCLAYAAPRAELQTMTWQVDGVTRTALVYLPAESADQSSIIFAFHGHRGCAQFAAKQFDFHTIWPEAICVYPHGLV